MLNEGEPVIGQYVRRIGGGIVRLRTVPVATQVRNNDAAPLPGQRAGPAVQHVTNLRP